MVRSIPRLSALPVALLLPSVGLLLAYLYVLSQRPSIPDYLTVSDPSAYGFPKWYGNSDSPYDAAWVDRGERFEGNENTDVVLIIDLPYDSPNLPMALSTEKVLKSRPDLSVRVFPSYSPPEDDEGWAKQCGQWVWRIGETPSSTEGCEGSVWISEILSTGQNESSMKQHDPRADIELLHRPQGLFEQQSTHAALKAQFGEDWQLGLMSHILPFADPSIYYPTTYKSLRTITYFPSPFTKPDNYPSLPWSSGWKLYRPTTSKPQSPEGKAPMAANSNFRSFWAQEEKRKSDVMRSSGVCIFEDWAEGQVTVEMAQAMLSGCIVAMIAPQTHYELLQPLVLTLPKPGATHGQSTLPSQALASLLAKTTDDDLKAKAMKAFIVARQMMTPVNRVKNVESLIELWQDGGRGYNLPHAFSWNCDTEPRPPWC